MINQQAFEQAKQQSIRDGFGDALVALGEKRQDVVALCGDLEESIRISAFAEKFPERFFEVGVAEQNLVGISAGLAKEGFTAFAGSYAAFSPGRTHDQIRVSVCYPKHRVVIVGGHAGLTVGPDGATHQAMEDLAMMRVLPNMNVLVPSDYDSAYALTMQAAKLGKPVYLRSSRVSTKSLCRQSDVILGKALTLLDGSDLTIVSAGVMVDRALQLAYDLQEQYGKLARVINLHTIKPLDTGALLKAARETGRILTLEEHQAAGGLGSTVAEFLIQNQPVPMTIVGMPDSFGQSGAADELLDAYGFDRKTLLGRATELLSRSL